MLSRLARADCLLVREPHAPAAKAGEPCVHHNACILTASRLHLHVGRKPLRLRRHGCDERLPISMLENPSAQRVVELYDGILKSRGRALSPASVILDYGCGSGRHA